jgi:hypothetical protein
MYGIYIIMELVVEDLWVLLDLLDLQTDLSDLRVLLEFKGKLGQQVQKEMLAHKDQLV